MIRLLAILLLAAALRSATVIPAVPPTAATEQSVPVLSPVAAEPDQWRTGALPVRIGPVRSGDPLRRTPFGISRGSSPASHGGSLIRSGVASWYPVLGFVAAVPGWHWSDTPYRLRVCAGLRCVVVTVQDWCGCPGGRIIDLSSAAFARLVPLSRGLVRVTTEVEP